MLVSLMLFLIAVLLFFVLKTVCAASQGCSLAGHRTLSRISKWQKKSLDPWAVFPIKQILTLTAKLVFLDEAAASRLGKDLEKAGLPITPQVYTARKYLTLHVIVLALERGGSM